MDFYERLEKELEQSSERSKVWEIVKRAMIKKDRWKQKTRGSTFKKGHDSRRAILKPEKRDQE